MNKEQRLQKLREEEKLKEEPKPRKEERLHTARKLKDLWKRRGDEKAEDDEMDKEEAEAGDEIPEEDEERIARELEEEEMIEMGEYVGDKDKFCTNCAMMPCSCLLIYLDLKLQTLSKNQGRAGDTRRESSTREAEDGANDAGHQHQCPASKRGTTSPPTTPR